MATPNYNYEKRQRELAKKKKKEEKLKERETRKADPADFSPSSSGFAEAPVRPEGHTSPVEPGQDPKV
jgi:uncharacterized membrane-anchored protein YhcB (DUF1043 family)